MRIFLIPDVQAKVGTPTPHLTAAGEYIAAKRPEVIVCIGDFWDMPSLSTYEKKGKKYWHGKSVMADIDAGNDAMASLLDPIKRYNKKRKKDKKKLYKPRMVFCMGNHEYRIDRAIADDPALEGLLSLDMLATDDWEVVPFLESINIEGVLFSHYFVNPLSLTNGTLCGTIENKLQKIGHSFCMGHQQTFQLGYHYLPSGEVHVGVVAGAFYSHREDYLGAQGNNHWRGCVMLNDVREGFFDPMPLSLHYLVEEWGDNDTSRED